jgi:hypothetical protein
VLFKIIYEQVCHGGNASLRLCRVSLLQRSLADDSNPALVGLGHLQRITHTGYTRADNEKIIFVSHFSKYLTCKDKVNIPFNEQKENLILYEKHFFVLEVKESCRNVVPLRCS